MADNDVSIRIDEKQLAHLQARLAPRRVDTIVYSAVKETTRHVGVLTGKAVQEQLNLKNTEYGKRAVKIILPRTGEFGGRNAEGIVRISKRPTPLWAFRSVRARKRGGVTATLVKGTAPIHFPHYFKATMPTGHIGIFGRSRHLSAARKGKASGWNRSRQMGFGPEGFVWRLAIKEVYGKSAYGLLVEAGKATPLTVMMIEEGRRYLAARIASKFRAATEGKI